MQVTWTITQFRRLYNKPASRDSTEYICNYKVFGVCYSWLKDFESTVETYRQVLTNFQIKKKKIKQKVEFSMRILQYWTV